jgi:hypothetical protein
VDNLVLDKGLVDNFVLVEGLVLPIKVNVTGDPVTLENDVGEFIINWPYVPNTIYPSGNTKLYLAPMIDGLPLL